MVPPSHGVSWQAVALLHPDALSWRVAWHGAAAEIDEKPLANPYGGWLAARPLLPEPDPADEAGLLAVVAPWLPVLDLLDLPDEQVRKAAGLSLLNGTSFARELVMLACVSEEQVFRAIALHLGVPFLPAIVPERLVLREDHANAMLNGTLKARLTPLAQPGGQLAFVVAHADIDIAGLRKRIDRRPELARRLCIAAPSSLRRALLALCEQSLSDAARYELFRRRLEFSARLVANAGQGALAATLVWVLVYGAIFATSTTLVALNVLATVAFFACIVVRLLAARDAAALRLKRLPPTDPKRLPVYSVLVALHKEREVLPQLVVALGRLQWPRSKLEIKLVCEADDTETLSALRAIRLRPNVEIVEVPPSAPRTKPKALSYALPLCTGEFVTLYDAEDKPHPLQLLDAWQRFAEEGSDLACLQAPLVVTNIEHNPIARLFGFEYAGLFRGMLPWLARQNAVLPLGGTSNHFRMNALRRIGGWDPYNVTEDADLGLRLKRLGYRAGVLSHPTFEDAPEDVATWLPQRVRWFKGWLQTWLVHMREPVALLREIGWRSFLLTQVLYLGMVVSALIHPVVLATLLVSFVRFLMGEMDTLHAGMLILACSNIAVGYLAFIALGGKALARRERRGFWIVVALTPVYWMLLSAAAWCALWEIQRRPHHWNKTPHRLARPVSVECGPPLRADLTARR